VKPVVVTRDEAADGPLSTELRNLGLSVLLWPAVTTVIADTGPLVEQLNRIGEFDWIVFASRHAVAAVTQHVPSRPTDLRVAAVGQATAQVLAQRGWTADLVPDDANAAALVAALEARMSSSGGLGSRTSPPKILFPASSRALPTIAAGLTQLGAQVVQVEAYQTDSAALDVAECRSWISREGVGAVTFASPSAVVELERALGRTDFEQLMAQAAVVAIGPTTARELIGRGHSPAVAESATLQGLAQTTYRLLQTRH
jgi:uroporphyrinogen III methyltransferase/synthase